MQKRAELLAHIQNTASQYNLEPVGIIAKSSNREHLPETFENAAVQISINANLEMINTYDTVITGLERDIIKRTRKHHSTSDALLKTIPGVGRIIALNLLYEIEDINRFPKVQNFVSYFRLVKCAKESNGKKYGSAGKKIGNAHLCWAFSETAQLFIKNNETGKKYLQRMARNMVRAKPSPSSLISWDGLYILCLKTNKGLI